MNSDDPIAPWLAGILEGEGYFGVIRSIVKGKTYLYPRVGVNMTDRDVIERVREIFGVKIYVMRPAGVSKKEGYRVVLIGSRAVEIMQLIRPWMGERRAAQIDRALAVHAMRPDPNESRRAWSSAAMTLRHAERRAKAVAS
jgi:hypothetical protein